MYVTYVMQRNATQRSAMQCMVCTDGWMGVWMDGCMDGWMDGGMDGWMDEWMSGWMDGWVDGRVDTHTVLPICCPNSWPKA